MPGLFEPLPLEDLYPQRTVRLVDGGVHDNQGLQGLMSEACNVVLCSDASGQMNDDPAPGAYHLGEQLSGSGGEEGAPAGAEGGSEVRIEAAGPDQLAVHDRVASR